MKVRLYKTANSWWYIDCNYKKHHWLYFNFLSLCLTFYFGKGAKYIP